MKQELNSLLIIAKPYNFCRDTTNYCVWRNIFCNNCTRKNYSTI